MKAEFAWPGGDRPGKLAFLCEPPKAISEALGQALAPLMPAVRAPEARLRVLFPSDEPVGRYWLSVPGESWFIRISSRSGNPRLEKAITDYLFERGVNVSRLLIAGGALEWEGQTFRIDVRPMLEGRHFIGSTNDLRNVASTLSACHRALMDFPLAHKVRAAASARYQRLANIRDLIRGALKRGTLEVFGENAPWASAQRAWLAEMVEQFDPHLEEDSSAQCVHGEIHPGNVIFRSADGEAVLVDFEESVQMFAPRAWDLAFLVQRFCLRDNPARSIGLGRVAIIADAYGGPVRNLSPMMRQAAWFSVATIVDLEISRGIATPSAECAKFVELERQAVAYADLV